MKKQNCWEFKRCGRRAGSSINREFGECPAASEKKFNGVNSGKNAGRICWVVAGTMCNGRVQGIFATKYKGCMTCEFYLKVRKEEGDKFQTTINLPG